MFDQELGTGSGKGRLTGRGVLRYLRWATLRRANKMCREGKPSKAMNILRTLNRGELVSVSHRVWNAFPPLITLPFPL